MADAGTPQHKAGSFAAPSGAVHGAAEGGPTPAPAPGPTPGPAPIATLRYQLQPRDMAAHLARSRAARRGLWQSLISAGFASLLALNFLAGKLPVPDNGWIEAAELALILTGPAALALWMLRRSRMAEAQEALPAPVQVTLDIHPDHLREDRADLPRPRLHRPRFALRIDRARGHVSLQSDTATLVIPARAFASRAEMRRLAAEWAGQMR